MSGSGGPCNCCSDGGTSCAKLLHIWTTNSERFFKRCGSQIGATGNNSQSPGVHYSAKWIDALTREGRYVDGRCEESKMNGLIYLVGLIVVILAILSFFGLR